MQTIRFLLFPLVGAVIGAGVVSMLIAPFISRLLALFPPVVTGSIIAVIGVSLMRVGVNCRATMMPDRPGVRRSCAICARR